MFKQPPPSHIHNPCISNPVEVLFSTLKRYSGGAIAGIVVGSLVGLGLIIGVIVCCCCVQRRRATSGQILQPQINHGFTVMTATTTTNGTQMQTTQLPPETYPPSYQTTPQFIGGYVPYIPTNEAINKPYGSPPPAYDQLARN
ncbi:hypothetical protein CHS0354_002457 [Potamilus streckersoni]|uniref:Cysteine and tyrosine-rich protein 1 n=1 Tax=Potamilus streckersoni TaxID=2493646 RepID=A0AAE0T9H6_9BIVA|nr:hypothetical protein CHS0354_002457 [Potamilus streckersoni]